MKNTNKKGFTIVELVIVIAVIAILAAVLIPTFASIVKKANLSNDKSFVRNANITLQAEGTVDKFATAGDAIDALNRNGFTGKFNTYSSNFHYCYSLENNTMYLLDDNNAVIYPEENVDKATLWGLYMDDFTSVTAGVTKYVAMTNITYSEHYNRAFGEGTFVIDLNDFFISVEASDAAKANVTAKNGIVLSGATAGEGVNTKYELFTVSGSKITGSDFTATGTEVVIKDKIFTKQLDIYFTGKNVKFENCIFYDAACITLDGSGKGAFSANTLTVENCKFINVSGWPINAGRSTTITGCTFIGMADRGAIQISENSHNMSVSISGCTFDGAGGEYPIIRFTSTAADHTDPSNAKISSLNISDCTFTSLNQGNGILGFRNGSESLVDYAEGDAATITFANNTVAESITSDKYVDNAETDTIKNLFAASVK